MEILIFSLLYYDYVSFKPTLIFSTVLYFEVRLGVTGRLRVAASRFLRLLIIMIEHQQSEHRKIYRKDLYFLRKNAILCVQIHNQRCIRIICFI